MRCPPLPVVATLAALVDVLVVVAVQAQARQLPGDLGNPGAAAGLPEERLVVVDTDAGADDAVAILQLLAAENLSSGPEGPEGTHYPDFDLHLPDLARVRVKAITCVSGNTGVWNVSRNVLATLNATNRLDVPVFAGAEDSLLVTPAVGAFFGEDGFGDFLPKGDFPVGEVQPEHAAVALVRLARESPGRITLLCIGPLTNVALAVRLDPRFLANLKEIFILGGSVRGVGNVGPGAEFNVWVDPEAAHVVLGALAASPSPSALAHLLPWETALDTLVTVDWRRNVLGAVDSEAVRLLNRAERIVLEAQGGEERWSASDGMLAAALLDRRCVASRTPARLVVVLGDPTSPTRGATLVDWAWMQTQSNNSSASPRTGTRGLNVVLLERADAGVFRDVLLRMLK